MYMIEAKKPIIYDRSEETKRIWEKDRNEKYMKERKKPNVYERKEETKHIYSICTKKGERKIPPNNF
jgi:hypothetical protein